MVADPLGAWRATVSESSNTTQPWKESSNPTFPKANISIRLNSTVPGLHCFWALLHWKAALSSTLEAAAVQGLQRSHSAHIKRHKVLYYVHKRGIICYEWSCNLMTCDVMEETPESSGRTAWWGSQAVDSIATNTVSSFVMSITAAMIIWWYKQKLQLDVCVSVV